MSFWIRNSSRRNVNDVKADSTVSIDSQVLPVYKTNNRPSGQYTQVGGSLGYDQDIKKVIYFDGSQWLPITGAGTTISGFAYYMQSQQLIPTGVPTVLTGWSSSPSPPFSSVGSFNPVTGVFTASGGLTVLLNVGVSWAGGFSTIGSRETRIVYNNSTIVKENVTQTDPALNVETTQELSATVIMVPGDTLHVEVLHSAPIQVGISNTVKTTLNGLEIQ